MARRRVVLCNGASGRTAGALRLDYRHGHSQNITLSLPALVRSLLHLPDRLLDLLELASYIFASDRLTARGAKDAVEYQAWARSFLIRIRVRDRAFWERPEVRNKLSELLSFMSGDREYEFDFQAGHSTPAGTLFDSAQALPAPSGPVDVSLFSGGIDSLSGVFELAAQSQALVCLVSHESQVGTIRTQRRLYEALERKLPGRLQRYGFRCTLHDLRAEEETQRTRMFLYGSIAASLAHSFSQSRFFVFENGVTAINVPRRQDLMNARATRTTHPQTLALMEEFLSLIWENPFRIEMPYQWHTKGDILKKLVEHGGHDLISSSVSCSRTFQNTGDATHCGACSQCIERRLASYAMSVDDVDDVGIYSRDFISRPIEEGETRTMLIDYIRLANSLAGANFDAFAREHINELAEVAPAFRGRSPYEVTERMWELLRRHGEQIMIGVRRIRDIHDRPDRAVPAGSLLEIISSREYLRDPVGRFVEDVTRRLMEGIPLAFKTVPPRDEPDLNDKISALLATERGRLEREYPAVSFALAKAVPDHSSREHQAFIETKFLRRATSASKATESMAADLTKYGRGVHIVFVVYDPDRSIASDQQFKGDFEKYGRCSVVIVR
jgi:DpnII restriction endonuclease/queuosine biosynthesis protein QueC